MTGASSEGRMPANLEHALITQVITNQDFASVIKARINEDFFQAPECKEVFRFLHQTYHSKATNGAVPSTAMVQMHYPSFHFAPAYDTVPVLCQALKIQKLRMDLVQLSNELSIKAEKDPLAAMAELRSEAIKMSTMADTSEDISMANAWRTLHDRYKAVQAAKGCLGIPYPWDPLNRATQGMQPGQFIVLYGRPKSMKTWVATWIATHAYKFARRRVLFYSREMSSMELMQRTACAMNRIDYEKYVNGELQPELVDQMFSNMQELEDDEKAAVTMGGQRQPYFIITTDRGSESDVGGVAWLQAKIRELQPDVVFVDGMYLMKDDRTNSRSSDWRQIAHISQDLKLTARQFDVPVVGITQANRNAEKTNGDDLTELAFSDSLGQDADAVFRIKKVLNREGKMELQVTAPGLREGKFDGMKIHGQPASNFDFISMLTDADREQPAEPRRKQADYGSSPPPPGMSFRKRPQEFLGPHTPSK
jgi:replicative DNA helicase